MAMIESKDRATSDPSARKDVLKQMEKEGVEYLLLWFTDLEGHLKSFAITPGESKVGRMICDVVKPDGEPYEGDPRYVMRRALERMNSLGFDTFNVGPELEYFL